VGAEGSATSSFGEYDFNVLSSVEKEVIVVGSGVDMVKFGNARVVIGSGFVGGKIYILLLCLSVTY